MLRAEVDDLKDFSLMSGSHVSLAQEAKDSVQACGGQSVAKPELKS